MNTKGLRISDEENNVISVKLSDILDLVENGDFFYWAVVFSDIIPYPEVGEWVVSFEKRLAESENGVFMSWEELKSLASKCYQEIDLDVIGSKNKEYLHRYSDEKKMYADCDIVIQMLDSSYWEIHSKDEVLLKRCELKFKKTKWL